MGAFSLIVEINLLNRFMATRSLTEVFILMRNNAIQHRQFFAKTVEDSVSDRTALVADEESFYGSRVPNGTPPEWADTVEDIQDRKLAKNVVSSLASSLQSLSTQFKQAQSDYL